MLGCQFKKHRVVESAVGEIKFKGTEIEEMGLIKEKKFLKVSLESENRLKGGFQSDHAVIQTFFCWDSNLLFL